MYGNSVYYLWDFSIYLEVFQNKKFIKKKKASGSSNQPGRIVNNKTAEHPGVMLKL